MSLRLLQSYASSSEESGADSEGESAGDVCSGSRNKKRKMSPVDAETARTTATSSKLQRVSVLPLPREELENLFPSQNGKGEADPSVHGGRIRTFAHVRGNWASFLHIPLGDSPSIRRQLEVVRKCARDCPAIELNVCDDIHLSLSKTLVFRHHWIEPFVDSMKKAACSLKRLTLHYQGFQVYVNEEGTRTFLAMDVHFSLPLDELLKSCDNVLKEFDLEGYYEDPSFHVSLFWSLGDQKQVFKNDVLTKLNESWRRIVSEEPELLMDVIDGFALKTGNKVYNFHLQ